MELRDKFNSAKVSNFGRVLFKKITLQKCHFQHLISWSFKNVKKSLNYFLRKLAEVEFGCIFAAALRVSGRRGEAIAEPLCSKTSKQISSLKNY
jgi:hypothetical protein